MKHWLLVAAIVLGLDTTSACDQRSLSFYHTHTGKLLSVVYYRNGDYVPDALERIDNYLKDFRTQELHAIDPALLDVLFQIKTKTRTAAPFEVISAYRSPQTNRMLRSKSTGVAENSLHLRGQAIDVRLSDVPLDRLREVSLSLKKAAWVSIPTLNTCTWTPDTCDPGRRPSKRR